MVKQVLIAAGGIGKRMPPELNPAASKHLIRHAGQTMIEHLIDDLKEGGVSEFIFATGSHSHARIDEIVSRKSINAVCHVSTARGFNDIPGVFASDLDPQFMFVCGHHPLSTRFVRDMLRMQTRLAIAKYRNKHHPKKSGMKNFVVSDDGEIRKFEEGEEVDLEDFWYLRNPYTLDKEIVRESRSRNDSESFGSLIYQAWKTDKRAVTLVEANFPPEFDYDYEYARTKRYLDSRATGMDVPSMTFSSLDSSTVEG